MATQIINLRKIRRIPKQFTKQRLAFDALEAFGVGALFSGFALLAASLWLR
jgi:hypothetical protein